MNTLNMLIEPNDPVMSIKGHTVFSKLMPDFIEGIEIDRMCRWRHCKKDIIMV